MQRFCSRRRRAGGGGAARPGYKTAPRSPDTNSLFFSPGATSAKTNMSHVDVKNLKPTSFEDEYYDEYEYYNLTDKYAEGSARKGRTKKEASDNTNRHNPAGHERKIVDKLQNSEKRAKE